MKTLHTAQEMTEHRLKKFHETLRKLCNTQRSFVRNFEIDQRHIIRRGKESDVFRYSLTPEVISAVITYGVLNLQLSRDGKPMRVAIEGKLLKFRWIDFAAMVERAEAISCIRVIIEQRTPRHLVVTAYRDLSNEIDPATTPEVKYDFW